MDRDKWKFRIGGVLLILVGLWNVFGFVMTIEFAKFSFSIIDIENIIITILMLYLGYIMVRYS
ncbi:hypothetical protein [Thermoanaerobacterium thermosaccharolyticum]|uniref:hypothetical protein n=1 Tax=Thermoanaerobacterium thermosaccharolyticum TaxID=1517 RepID=UPI0012390E91|nr:hypothetical protein [Thermoanaerobacterium thermosaccharolyticum]KAA5807358.1 hypothetical protein F1655_04480 [Thermoanaerobacterium thermosaccharolyticum]